MDEVPTQAPDFIVSLSIALDSDLTANLIDALTRGAGGGTLSVESRGPRRKFSRRGSARRGTPPTSPHKASGSLLPGGDGLRPAGLMLRGRHLQYRAHVPFETSSTAIAVPLLLQGEGLSAR